VSSDIILSRTLSWLAIESFSALLVRNLYSAFLSFPVLSMSMANCLSWLLTTVHEEGAVRRGKDTRTHPAAGCKQLLTISPIPGASLTLLVRYVRCCKRLVSASQPSSAEDMFCRRNILVSSWLSEWLL
jgi:hypothetical protein